MGGSEVRAWFGAGALAACLLLAQAPARAADADAAGPAAAGGIRIAQLAEGIYAALRTDPPGLMVDANSLFIVNEDDVVVVDAPEHSAALIDALRTITTKPVSFLVNTHWHDDHIAGNAAWRAAYPDVRFIGHPALAEYLPGEGARNRAAMIAEAPGFAREMERQMARGLNLQGEPIDAEERASYASDVSLVAHYMQVVPDSPVLLPDLEVDARMTLARGTRRIEIIHPGRAHTAADLVVWLPQERVLACGDIVSWPVPLVGSPQSHVQAWPATLDALLALDPALIVPGHGPVLHDARYALQVRGLLARIDAAARAVPGESLAALRKRLDLGAERAAFAGDSRVRRTAFGMYVEGPAVESAWHAAQASP